MNNLTGCHCKAELDRIPQYNENAVPRTAWRNIMGSKPSREIEYSGQSHVLVNTVSECGEL